MISTITTGWDIGYEKDYAIRKAERLGYKNYIIYKSYDDTYDVLKVDYNEYSKEFTFYTQTKGSTSCIILATKNIDSEGYRMLIGDGFLGHSIEYYDFDRLGHHRTFKGFFWSIFSILTLCGCIAL